MWCEDDEAAHIEDDARAGALGTYLLLTPEEYTILRNALEMRLIRCQDNNWRDEASVLQTLIEKFGGTYGL